jgi:hypothetical protein
MTSTIAVGNVLTANLVEADDQSVGGGLFQTSYTIGSALGVSMSSLVIQGRQTATGSLLTGVRDAFWLNGAMAWFGK